MQTTRIFFFVYNREGIPFHARTDRRSRIPRDIYVHGKIMLIDHEWATIGSCNLHANSLSGQTEMNAAIWDANVVRPLRCELLKKHLDRDTTDLGAREALQLYREIAQQNRGKRDTSDPDW
jgi:cardiolipin synthase